MLGVLFVFYTQIEPMCLPLINSCQSLLVLLPTQLRNSCDWFNPIMPLIQLFLFLWMMLPSLWMIIMSALSFCNSHITRDKINVSNRICFVGLKHHFSCFTLHIALNKMPLHLMPLSSSAILSFYLWYWEELYLKDSKKAVMRYHDRPHFLMYSWCSLQVCMPF